jgi:hypothetical protein
MYLDESAVLDRAEGWRRRIMVAREEAVANGQ